MKPVNVVKYLIAGLILFTACSPDTDKISKVYVELKVVKEKSRDSLAFKKLRNKIFKKYNISESEYLDDLQKISSVSEEWESFNDKAISYVDTLLKRSGKSKNTGKAAK